jgi:hypothetical protein
MRARLLVLIGTGAVAAALIASAALAVDLFLFAKVTGRAPGTNDATVAVRWDFKCLGDKLGAADFEYTLVAVRVKPAPSKTITIRSDTTKKGSTTVRLPAGTWQAQADPFLCETERGAGSTQPEVGQTVEVPDYCAWTVQRARGAVALETAASVKRARPGLGVAPGSTVVTPAGGQATIQTTGRDASALLGAGTRLSIDAKQCYARSGWRLSLAMGDAALTARAGADATRDHDVATPNALVTGRAATWSVQTSRKQGAATTTVRVRAGSVRVKGKSGAPVTVRAGFRTTVVGAAAPVAPSRG